MEAMPLFFLIFYIRLLNHLPIKSLIILNLE